MGKETDFKYFATQKADEKVIMVVRRHWTVYAPSFVFASIGYISAMVFFLNLDRVSVISTRPLIKASVLCLLSLTLLSLLLYSYLSWLINYLNVEIVTNEHIVDINQMGLFSRKISELCLSDIQDVSATKKGIFQSFLDYGNISIQTAGEKENFAFDKVSNPDEIARQIMEIKDQYEDGEGRAEAKDINQSDQPILN